MTWHIIGVDLSLTGTGLAIRRPTESDSVHLELVGSASPQTPKGQDPYPATLRRLRDLRARIIRVTRHGIEPGDVGIAVIEGPSLGSNNAHTHTRDGLWWLVYSALVAEGYHVVVVPPASLKRYVTGNGNANKGLMLERSKEAYPGINFRGDDNLVDAHGLGAMGCRELGFPVEPSAKRITVTALNGVPWPAFFEQNRSTTHG